MDPRQRNAESSVPAGAAAPPVDTAGNDLAALCAALQESAAPAFPSPQAQVRTASPVLPSPRPTGLRRWLTPSFSDLFCIALVMWMFATGDGWAGLLLDGDAGWHIRTGEYILDQGHVPHQDLFSFSKPDAEWFAWEWAADVTDALVFRALGLKGVVLLTGVICTLFGLILLRHMLWRGANTFVALALSLMSISVASIHFHARPHVWTLLFLPVALWMIDADRRAPSLRIWLLVPLVALWTNLHGGFLIAVAVLGLAAIGEGVDALRQGAFGKWNHPQWGRALRYVLVAAAAAAASLANPYGWQLHRHIVTYLQSDWIRTVIQEFQSPSFRGENMAQFEMLLLAGLVAAGWAWRRGDSVAPLFVLFFAHQSLSAARHVPLYAIVAAPILASELTRGWKALVLRSPRNSVPAILDDLSRTAGPPFQWSSVWFGAFVCAMVLMGHPFRWPNTFPKEQFPVDLVERHRQQLESSRVFTYDQWADYLIYRSYPNQRVFFDGRSDFYGPEIGKRYVAMASGEREWQRWLREYNFAYVLAPTKWPLVSLLKQSSDWNLLEDTGKALLFARRSPPVTAAEVNGFPPPLVRKSYRPEKMRVASLMKVTNAAEVLSGDHE